MTKLQQKLARTYEEDGYSATLTFWTENQDEINALSEKERNALKSMMSRYCRINGDEKTAEVVLAEEKNPGNSEIANFFFEFAQIYQYGKTVAKNEMKAAECFKKAALCGNKFAQYRLGEMYMLGLGVEKSRAEAEKWYDAANTEKNFYSNALTRMVIPDGIDYIAQSAFEGFESLRSVTIPESVERIDGSAFKGCKSLESVKFQNENITIKSDAFVGCDALDGETKKLIEKYSGMVFVEGGTFNREDYNVTVSSFLIGKYPVTQELYESIMGRNPSNFTGEKRPAECVSWYDAVEFCNALSRKEGLTLCYTGSGNWINCDFSANGYRLPTEAEWEFAARGGNKSNGYEYSGSNEISKVAWYSGNSDSSTHDVGQKKPNELGIYDMSGNVWEWCNDWYGDYGYGDQTDPRGSSTGYYRVRRGGSWNYDADICHVAHRGYYYSNNRVNLLGFRLVRSAQ